MKKRMGRPLLDKTAKDELLAVRVGRELARPAANQAKGANQSKSQWLRTAIENQIKGPPIWVKSKWKKEELNGQYIRFDLKSPGRELAGVGKLAVMRNSPGEIAVDIFIDECLVPHRGVLTRIWLAEDAVDRIELNRGEDADKIKFSLVG
jgi:hypothetical protein